MKAQLICNGKTIEVEVADEQFEKLFAEEKKKTGYERVENNEFYWFMDSGLEEMGVYDQHSSSDNERYEFANYFSDKTVAENMARAQRLWNKIHRRAVELCKPINQWKEDIVYIICFNPYDSDLYATRWSMKYFGEVNFETEEHCQQVIDEFHDELMWYFTEFIDRADM